MSCPVVVVDSRIVPDHRQPLESLVHVAVARDVPDVVASEERAKVVEGRVEDHGDGPVEIRRRWEVKRRQERLVMSGRHRSQVLLRAPMVDELPLNVVGEKGTTRKAIKG